MKKLVKRFNALQQNGNNIMSLFTNTLKRVEEHQETLDSIERDINQEIIAKQELVASVKQEQSTAAKIQKELKRIVGVSEND